MTSDFSILQNDPISLCFAFFDAVLCPVNFIVLLGGNWSPVATERVDMQPSVKPSPKHSVSEACKIFKVREFYQGLVVGLQRTVSANLGSGKHRADEHNQSMSCSLVNVKHIRWYGMHCRRLMVVASKSFVSIF